MISNTAFPCNAACQAPERHQHYPISEFADAAVRGNGHSSFIRAGDAAKLICM